MASSNVVTRARVEGLVIVCVAAAYLWQAHEIPDLFQMPGVPGPTAFPTLVGAVFGLAGLWRLVFARSPVAELEAPWAEGDDGPPPAAGDAKQPEAARPSWLSQHGRFYAMWAVLLAYMATMPIVGFPVTTVVALALLFRLLGERRWPLVFALSLGTTVVLYAAFAWGLAVQLPRGVLDAVLK